MAAHVDDSGPTRFDLKVADRAHERTTATLQENGSELLRWQLDGTAISGTGAHAGLDLKQLSKWKQDLPPRDAERATMLRRAVFVSGARQFNPPPGLRAADQGSQRMGVCYNYQLPQAETSTRTPDWLSDFTAPGSEPLVGFDGLAVFVAECIACEAGPWVVVVDDGVGVAITALKATTGEAHEGVVHRAGHHAEVKQCGVGQCVDQVAHDDVCL